MESEITAPTYGVPTFSGNFSVSDAHVKKCLSHVRRAHFGHVISIVGHDNICGIGKTTFASRLVTSVDCVNYFQLGIAWISVGKSPSDDELLMLVRTVATQILQIAARKSIGGLGEVNSDMSRHFHSQCKGSVQDCLVAIRAILQLAQSVPDSEESLKCLVVLDDVWDDRLVRLLTALPLVVLLTTRCSQIFSDGKIPGTVYYLEAVAVEQKSRVLCRYAGLYEQASAIPPVALEVLSTAHSLFEVSILSRIISSHIRDSAQLKQLLQRRVRDGVVSNSHNKWIANHADGSWHGLDLMSHVGALTALDLCLEQLDASTHRLYLLLCLFPPGVPLSREYLMLLWGLTESTEYVAVVEMLVAKQLVVVSVVDGVRTLQLHYLHHVFLKLAVLRCRRPQTESAFVCFAFFDMGEGGSAEGEGNIYYAVQKAADRLLSHLSSINEATMGSASILFPVWRSLNTCYEIGLLLSCDGPIVYLLRASVDLVESAYVCSVAPSAGSDAGTAAGSGGGSGRCEICVVADYLQSASRIIEQIAPSNGSGSDSGGHRAGDNVGGGHLKTWYLFVLQALDESRRHTLSIRRSSDGTDAAQDTSVNPRYAIHRTTEDIELQMGVVLNKVGEICCREGDMKTALEHHMKALRIFQSDKRFSTAQLHNRISGTFASIASIFLKLQAHEEAVRIIQSIIKFKEGLHGATCRDNASAWQQLGDLYTILERHNEALFAYDSAFHIHTVHQGLSHCDTVLAEASKSVAMIHVGDPLNGAAGLYKCINFLLQHDYAPSDPAVARLLPYLSPEQRDRAMHAKSLSSHGCSAEPREGRESESGLFCGLFPSASSRKGDDSGSRAGEENVDASEDFADNNDEDFTICK